MLKLTEKEKELAQVISKDFDKKYQMYIFGDVRMSDELCNYILNLIKKGNIKFVSKFNGVRKISTVHKFHDHIPTVGCFSPLDNSITFHDSYINVVTFLHEFSHYIDFKNKLTSSYLSPSFNKTFNEILLDELDTNQDELLYECFSEIKEKIDEEQYSGFFDNKIFPYLKNYSKLASLDHYRVAEKDESVWEEEQVIFNKLYKSGFVTDFCKSFFPLAMLKNYLYFTGKKSSVSRPAMEALLIKFDLTNFGFIGHDYQYFLDLHGQYTSKCGEEVFAELYLNYLLKREVDPMFSRILPKTSKAFIELCEHIKEIEGYVY